ncbi:hypothetical protein PQX77_002042 [Marasmius sp. AFHP31]|nr:hypothetical protein PQX77_002042 [Marasmius sp. AFHP31]
MQTTSPAGSMLSGFFYKARNTHINGGNYNHVQGDQYNNYNYTTIVQAREEELTEFDEYYRVKRGALLKLKDVGCSTYPRRWDDGDRERWEEGKPRVDRTICTARVLEQPGMVFTVVQYSGPDARRTFEDDFRMLSRILNSTASQIYGYTKSEIPSLILYNELIPAAHFRVGWLGRNYLGSIARQLGCETGIFPTTNELWMDCGRGAFCRGPPGPARAGWSGFRIGDIPLEADFLQADFLQEDVLLRFLASLKSKEVDHDIIWQLNPGGLCHSWPPPPRVSQPTVTSTLTNTPIAVANNTWGSRHGNLSDVKSLENGLTRFTLTHPPRYIWLQLNCNADEVWMSQAWSIFGARGISLEDDLSVYKLVSPAARLESINIPGAEYSEAQREQQFQQPIYLFVRQPPSDLSKCKTSSLHHWSFHKDGRSPLSHKACCSLGLPIELDFIYYNCSYSAASDNDYRCLHQYQLNRGFDPSTADFARHLGYYNNVFQPVDDSNRFEIQQEPPSESKSSTLTSDVSDNEDLGYSASPTAGSATSRARHGPTTFWSPIYLPFPSEVTSELGPTMEAETLDGDVD